MAQETVANLLDVLKEVWTQDRLERQFYDGTKWLDKVERTNKYTIGRKALVPLETSLPGGESTFGAAGGTLNEADPLHVDTAEYTLSYPYQNVAIQVAALNQGDAVGNRSTVDAADQTIASNVTALRRAINRQAVGNQDALIAQCTTTTASTEVELLSTGYGPDALNKGWLRKGMTVDIGTTAAEAAVVGDARITAVEKSASTPSITIGSAVTTSSSHYVSVAGARSGSTSNETNGLRNILGSSSSTVGGLAPSTEPTWAPAYVDTSTTLISLDLLVQLQTEVYTETGSQPTEVFTSAKQAGELFKLFHSQVRYNDGDPKLGKFDSFRWGTFNITVDPDIPDRELYLINLKDFLVVTGGAFGKPTWMSEIEGSGGRLRWNQQSTYFVDAVTYPLQIAVKRRNGSAAAIGLTA